MNSAVMFLLGVLHALVITMVSPMVSRRDVLRSVSASQHHEFAQWSASNARVPEETVRVPLRTTASVVLRTSGPLPFGRATALPINAVSPFTFAPATFSVARAYESDAHRLASRGSVLPYFPTAPPHSA